MHSRKTFFRHGCCVLAAFSSITMAEPDPVDPAFEVDKTRPTTLLRMDTRDSPVPWSRLDFRNDPNEFQFAIVSDRTGGHRWGVFQDAIFKLNLLQPEFVMSIGDLIEGYTDDLEVLNREWDEFTGFINELDPPFFYVAGNHDISNPTMAELWRERFGAAYYTFLYKDVLFLCLNSNDGAMHQIGKAQTAWAEQVLARHTDVRWTLVFVHRPFWDSSNEKDFAYWAPFEQALGDREYTVFAGHYHSYTRMIRNDRRHITLATTGGSSGLRGPSFGEFDHVAWVTMTDDGPVIANLMLDGIQDENIRTENLRSLGWTLRRGSRNEIRSELLTRPSMGTMRREIKVTNDLDVPLHYRAKVTTPGHIDLRSESWINLTVEPNSVLTWPLTVHGDMALNGEVARVAEVEWSGRADFGPEQYELTGTSALHAVRARTVNERSLPVSIDGNLDDWPRLSIVVDEPAQILIRPEAWRGKPDGHYRFDLAADEEALFIAVEVFDDHVAAVPGDDPWKQDGIEIRIDARQPAKNRTNENQLIFIALSPGDHSDGETPLNEYSNLPEGSRYACFATSRGYVAEVSIPAKALDDLAEGPWENFRFNVQVDDTDPEEGTSQLNWMPDWRTPGNILQSGTFVRDAP